MLVRGDGDCAWELLFRTLKANTPMAHKEDVFNAVLGAVLIQVSLLPIQVDKKEKTLLMGKFFKFYPTK